MCSFSVKTKTVLIMGTCTLHVSDFNSAFKDCSGFSEENSNARLLFARLNVAFEANDYFKVLTAMRPKIRKSEHYLTGFELRW